MTRRYAIAVLLIAVSSMTVPLSAQQSDADASFKKFLDENPEKKEQLRKDWIGGIMVRAEIERASQICAQPQIEGAPETFQKMLSMGRFWFGDKIVDDAIQRVDVAVRGVIDKGDLNRFCAAAKLNEMRIYENNLKMIEKLR